MSTLKIIAEFTRLMTVKPYAIQSNWSVSKQSFSIKIGGFWIRLEKSQLGLRQLINNLNEIS